MCNFSISFFFFALEFFLSGHKFFFSFSYTLLFADMAGLAPEGSQFDARQYDAKLNELYYFSLFILLPFLLYPLFLCHGLVPSVF